MDFALNHYYHEVKSQMYKNINCKQSKNPDQLRKHILRLQEKALTNNFNRIDSTDDIQTPSNEFALPQLPYVVPKFLLDLNEQDLILDDFSKIRKSHQMLMKGQENIVMPQNIVNTNSRALVPI